MFLSKSHSGINWPLDLSALKLSILYELHTIIFFQAAHVMLKDLLITIVMLPPDIVSVTPMLLEIAVTNAPLEALTSQLVKVLFLNSKTVYLKSKFKNSWFMKLHIKNPEFMPTLNQFLEWTLQTMILDWFFYP